MNRLFGHCVGKTSILPLVTWLLLTGLNSPAEATSTLTLEQPGHFMTSEGSDVLIKVGSYEVDTLVGSRLLLKVEGEETLFLDAQATTHSEEIEEPLAVTILGEDPDVVHIVLLLPNGQALDAVGSLSGTRSRGTNVLIASTAQIHASVLKQITIVGGYRGPSDFDLAYYHAPIHYQDTDSSNYRADYITRYDYDNNMVATDNWENLNKFPLIGYAYYSVVETCTHWFLVYGFFHPRDWTDSSMDQEHENDLEGLLTIVRKDSSRFGRLEGMVTVYHDDFYSFTPPGSPLGNGKETIDGRLTMQSYEGSYRPLTVQQAKGHGLKAFPYTSDFHGKSNEDGIIYYPARTPGQVPQTGNDRHINYNLIDLFSAGGLWEGQLSEAKMPSSASKIYHNWGTFKGNKGGGCGNGITVTCSENAAHLPWSWDDHDDDRVIVNNVVLSRIPSGELALDPAHLVALYFNGLGNFSQQYVRNRYLSDLRSRGFRQGNLPNGWPSQLNLDQLFTKLISTCG